MIFQIFKKMFSGFYIFQLLPDLNEILGCNKINNLSWIEINFNGYISIFDIWYMIDVKIELFCIPKSNGD